MSFTTISAATRRRLRHRRDVRQFEQALREASPNMQHELLILAQRQNFLR